MMALSLDSTNQLNLERKGGKKIKTKKQNIPGLTEHVISHGLFFPPFLPYEDPAAQRTEGTAELVLIQLTINIGGCRRGNRPSVNGVGFIHFSAAIFCCFQITNVNCLLVTGR